MLDKNANTSGEKKNHIIQGIRKEQDTHKSTRISITSLSEGLD